MTSRLITANNQLPQHEKKIEVQSLPLSLRLLENAYLIICNITSQAQLTTIHPGGCYFQYIVQPVVSKVHTA